ncbi:MAG TPA: metal ABC transporter ATP-binding protein [Myxococcota bacterium]|nr:metal ABC transporter ATP-binding protein [Myxococcota bacterium]
MEPAECTDCGQKRGDLCRHDPKTTAICFDDVSVNFGGVQILDSVTARIPRGGCTCIVGPNGAGKTTLLMTLLGKISHSGAVRIGSTPDGRAARVGYVPQRLAFDRGMPLTVMEFLAMGSQRRPLWLGISSDIRERATRLLEMVGAGALARRRVGALSGGELQRVLLALAFQQDPDLLILDEPAAGVDFRGGQIFCELLENLRAEHGFTQVMVTHDLGLAASHATYAILLNGRVIAEGNPTVTLNPENLTRAFGTHMGGAVIGPLSHSCGCEGTGAGNA